MKQWQTWINNIFKLMLPALFLFLFPSSIHADQGAEASHENQVQTITEFPEDNLLVLKVMLGRSIVLTDAMVGYQYKDTVFLSLDEFAQSLEFFINTDHDTGIASGWFIDERKTFHLDVKKKKVTIAGKERAIKPGQVEISADGILVAIETLQEWFPLSLEFVQDTLTLSITSQEPLPIEVEMERERKHDQLGKNNASGGETYRRIVSPYRLATIPFANLTYNTAFSSAGDNSSSDHGSFQHTANVLLTGDLLYLNSNLFLSATSEQGLSGLRLELERKSAEGNLLGLLEATEISLGDVYTPKIPLICEGQAGRGMSLSNFPLEHVSEFDTIVIRDHIEPDWEVELYRNEVLLAFQRTGKDGGYEFLDVPLLSGLNIIKLIFYGPFNQKREKIFRYFMNSDLLKKGSFYYRISANQHNEDLITIRDETDRYGTNIEGPKQGKSRWSAEFEYGLARQTSLTSDFTSIPLDDGQHHNYGSLGMRTTFGGVYGLFNITRHLDDEKGMATQTSLQTSWRSYSIIAGHDHFFHNFISELENPSADPLVGNTEVRLNSSVRVLNLTSLPLELKGEIEEYDSGKTNINFNAKLSLAIKCLHNTWEYEFRKAGTDSDPSHMLNGDLLLSINRQKLDMRANLQYELQPDLKLGAGTLTADYPLNSNLSLRAGIDHRFQGDEFTSYSFGLSLNKSFEHYKVGLNTAYSDSGTFTLTLSLATSIGPGCGEDKIVVSSQANTQNGIVYAKAFLDENQNGRFDDQDTPLPDIGFKLNGGTVQGKTNDQGVALLADISPYRPVRISVDNTSFEDPYWVAVEEAVEVIIHPGVPLMVDFPISETGEVDGTVYLIKNGQENDERAEASNVEIEVVNKEGKVIRKTKTAGDGFYLLDKVPLGSYWVQVSEAQRERLNLKKVEAQKVILTREEPVISGIDFTIELSMRRRWRLSENEEVKVKNNFTLR